MADVIIQIYGIRTVEDARMVIDMGGHHIGVSYGKIKRTPGQLTCEKAKEIFEGVQPEAVKIGLTVAEDIEEITENLKVVLPDVLHLSGDIEGIKPDQVQELKNRFPGLRRFRCWRACRWKSRRSCSISKIMRQSATSS